MPVTQVTDFPISPTRPTSLCLISIYSNHFVHVTLATDTSFGHTGELQLAKLSSYDTSTCVALFTSNRVLLPKLTSFKIKVGGWLL